MAKAKKASAKNSKAGAKTKGSNDKSLEKRVKGAKGKAADTHYNSDKDYGPKEPKENSNNGSDLEGEVPQNTASQILRAYRRDTSVSSDVKAGLANLKYHRKNRTSDKYATSRSYTAKGISTFKKTKPSKPSLETMIEGAKKRAYTDLKKSGHTKQSAKEVVYGGKKEKGEGDYPLELSIGNYLKRSQHYKGRETTDDMVKGAIYLAASLLTPLQSSDYQKKIDDGAQIIFINGYANVPRSVKKYEKAMGEKIAFLPTKDPKKLKKAVDYANSKGVAPELIGFSDGGKVIDGYLELAGDQDISQIYAVATGIINNESKKITYIRGDRDRLACAEDGYKYMDDDYDGPQAEVVYGGHTYFVFDPVTISQVSNKINSKRENPINITPISSQKMNKAA